MMKSVVEGCAALLNLTNFLLRNVLNTEIATIWVTWTWSREPVLPRTASHRPNSETHGFANLSMLRTCCHNQSGASCACICIDASPPPFYPPAGHRCRALHSTASIATASHFLRRPSLSLSLRETTRRSSQSVGRTTSEGAAPSLASFFARPTAAAAPARTAAREKPPFPVRLPTSQDG